jgi:hypothetical protein
MQASPAFHRVDELGAVCPGSAARLGKFTRRYSMFVCAQPPRQPDAWIPPSLLEYRFGDRSELWLDGIGPRHCQGLLVVMRSRHPLGVGGDYRVQCTRLSGEPRRACRTRKNR